MMTLRRHVALLSLWIVLGCGSDEQGSGGAGGTTGSVVGAGGTASAGGAGGTTGATGGVGAGTGAVVGGSGGTAAGEGGASAGSGGTSAGAGGTSAGAGGTAAGTCDAAGTGGGTPMLLCNQLGGTCGGCIRDKCCELTELCTVDADCACMATCIGSASLSGTDGCLGTCRLTGSPPGFADLANCAATTCPDGGDECNAPAGFEPPPDIAPSGSTSSAGIGSGALADCSFSAPDATGAVLQLQNADGTVCVRIERRNDGPGSLSNTSWTLLNMRVGPLGEVVLVDNSTDLCWYSSHHNFNDWAHAWSGSRHYDVKTALTGHGATPTYTLHVFEQGPLAGGSCAPTGEGTCPIATMDLFPAP